MEQFVIFYCDRNAMSHILNFVLLSGAPELLDQGTAPVSEFPGTGFGQSQPVVCGETTFFSSITLEMCESKNKLSRHRALFMREVPRLMAQAAIAYRLFAYARRAIISPIVGM